jgi:hypothetical protein
MAGLGEMFQRLIGGSPAPEPIAAAPLSGYPTPEDAAYARKYDFGYGTGNEPYTQGNVARVVGEYRGPNFKPYSAEGLNSREAISLATNDEASRNLDLRTPGTSDVGDRMGTALAQAALAANRVPVAGLGFDPSRAAFDVKIQNPTIAGMYGRKEDAIYAALNPDPSAIVHESIHRGLEKLRQNPDLAGLFARLPASEELLVRYLMATQAGDPEQGGGKVDQEQRQSALDLIGNGFYRKVLPELNRAAEEAYAARRPRGPR